MSEPTAPEPISDAEEFCDSHCYWLEHHPDCTVPVGYVGVNHEGHIGKFRNAPFGRSMPVFAHPPKQAATLPSADWIFEQIKHGDEQHQHWLLAKLRAILPQPVQPDADRSAQLAMNDALNDFAKRWALNGDWLTCKICKLNLIASRADETFVHAADCKAEAEPKPWRTLISILAPLAASTGGAA